MNNLYEIHNFVRFIEYFTFNTSILFGESA